MKWFKTAHSIEEVKRIYRQLCKQYHPDLNEIDTTEIMKQINTEYERAFNHFKNIHESAEDNSKTYTSSKETSETAAEFMVIINKLIVLEGVNVELIGRWIWISGNTFPHKDVIKSLGFKWCSNKRMWSYHKDEDASHNRKKMTIDEIKNKYGCETFKSVSTPKLATV